MCPLKLKHSRVLSIKWTPGFACPVMHVLTSLPCVRFIVNGIPALAIHVNHMPDFIDVFLTCFVFCWKYCFGYMYIWGGGLHFTNRDVLILKHLDVLYGVASTHVIIHPRGWI